MFFALSDKRYCAVPMRFRAIHSKTAVMGRNFDLGGSAQGSTTC
jgi:hypothetical protein